MSLFLLSGMQVISLDTASVTIRIPIVSTSLPSLKTYQLYYIINNTQLLIDDVRLINPYQFLTIRIPIRLTVIINIISYNSLDSDYEYSTYAMDL